MNAGEKTIDWLYRDQLQVDKKWSVKLPRGFIWWPDQNAQSIEIVGGEDSLYIGEETFHIRVKTELLRGLTLNKKSIPIINRNLMLLASMSGPVYDPATGVLSLSSIVRTYESITRWMRHLISMAAVLQIAEARALRPELARAAGGTFATSGHPKNGRRSTADELADGGLLGVIAAEGAKQGVWKEEFEKAGEYIHAPPSLDSNGDETSFTAEFPWGEFSSLCQFKGDEVHPVYGRGLLVRQSFPLPIDSDVKGIKLALELNCQELDQTPSGYGFGSYSYNSPCVEFVAFFPNFVCREGLVRNLYFSSIDRARATSRRLIGDDWSEQFVPSRPPRSRSAAQRLAERYLGEKPVE